jgi:two-component system response regulator DctR
MPHTNATVLLIEDNPMTQEVARMYLEELGHTLVGCAPDGEEGLNLAHSLRPDIALLDVFLPTANGFDVLKELKNQSPETVVIMLSGSDDAASMKQATELGAKGYLTKPFKLGDMRRVLEKTWGEEATSS